MEYAPHLELELTEHRCLLKGNEAAALGAIQAECKYFAGYPITPVNEVTEYLAAHFEKVGGRFLQGSSELESINAAIGAAATGVRTLVASSGLGTSLKTEGFTYAVGEEVPLVYLCVMRGGPGLGNIFPAQADYGQITRGMGSGDSRVISLLPQSPQEMYEFTMFAFALADAYRTPVVVVVDALIGQMQGLISIKLPRFAECDKSWAVTGRLGSGSKIITSFNLTEGLSETNKVLMEKWSRIMEREPRFDTYNMDGAEVVLVAFGTAAAQACSAADVLAKRGVRAGLFEPKTGWPFPAKGLRETVRSAEPRALCVVEMSILGQVEEDVRLALSLDGGAPLSHVPVFAVRTSGGVVPTIDEIVAEVSSVVAGLDKE